ncbi:hypothetical protein H5410_024003 [Solanum commersonii]|uniref:Uncharacterized protein n=1 Tax=Solanum commersonii TaxID=4109 RepID=A0A9J5ZKR5_SOLCO|nr:hypothetical protein H5410_024003 [Solanum commersonii]
MNWLSDEKLMNREFMNDFELLESIRQHLLEDWDSLVTTVLKSSVKIELEVIVSSLEIYDFTVFTATAEVKLEVKVNMATVTLVVEVSPPVYMDLMNIEGKR